MPNETSPKTTIAPASLAPEAAHTGPIASSRMIEYEVDDDIVLYDPRTDAVNILNETAAAVWWLCDGSRSRDEIVAEIARLYQADLEEVADDVDVVLADLTRIKAIEQR